MPYNIAQDQLMKALDEAGFRNCYDFLYAPSTLGTQRGKGYAFVNFQRPEDATRLFQAWNGSFRFHASEDSPCVHVLEAKIQGRDANVKRWEKGKRRRIRNPKNRPLISSLEESELESRLHSEPAKPLRPIDVMRMVPVAEGVSSALVGQQCLISGLTAGTLANGCWGVVEAQNPDGTYQVNVVYDAPDAKQSQLTLSRQNLLWHGDACKDAAVDLA